MPKLDPMKDARRIFKAILDAQDSQHPDWWAEMMPGETIEAELPVELIFDIWKWIDDNGEK